MSTDVRRGALITPELTALVHWTTGRCSNVTPQEAVLYGNDLIAKIQQELEQAHHRGADSVRARIVSGPTDVAQIHYGETEKLGYTNGAVV